MRLRVIATGSRGNCYVLYNESEKLIIDLGVDFNLFKKEIDFSLNNISGVLLSHAHT
jgi:phosphoribosyl 1,2-cyclic phosphodiesterase